MNQGAITESDVITITMAWIEPIDRADADARKSQAVSQYSALCTELGGLSRTPDSAERRARLLRKQDLLRDEITKIKAWITKHCSEGRRMVVG